MTQTRCAATGDPLRALLAVLTLDAAHHTRCAAASEIDEGRLVHGGFAAGFQQAALYVADLITTGAIRTRSGHRVLPEDEAAADRVLDALADGPEAARKAILDSPDTR